MTNQYVPLLFLAAIGGAFAVFSVVAGAFAGPKRYNRAKLLPGFTWLTWPSFLLGLIEAFLYGIYFGLVFVPLYNFFQSRLSRR